MAFRIFITIIALANFYVIYHMIQISRAAYLLDSAPPGYSTGAEDADVTIVEFLEYSCSNCRIVHPVIQQAVQKDGKVRYIVRPLATDEGQDPLAQFVYAA